MNIANVCLINYDFMAFRAAPQHSSSKLGSAFGLHLNSNFMAFRAAPQHSSSKLGSAFGLHLNSDFMAFRASPQHSSSKLGSAFGLHLNSDLDVILFYIACNDIRAVFTEQVRQWQIAFLISVSIKFQDSFADRFLSLEQCF